MLSVGVNGKRLRSVPLEKQKAGIQKCIFSGCQKTGSNRRVGYLDAETLSLYDDSCLWCSPSSF